MLEMTKFNSFGFLLLAVQTATLVGCGSDSGVTLVPVSGEVTVAGKPVEGIVVSLSGNSDGKKRVIPYGRTDAGGKYALQVSETDIGAPAGQYKVLFQKITLPDGSAIPEGKTAADVGAVNQLPDVYGDPGRSPESATIPETGTTTLNFDLSPKTKR